MDEVFTEADNKLLDNPISDEDVKASLLSANRNSSPGSDGLTYLTYLACWDSLGHHLSEVLREIVTSGKLPESMKNSFLVFSPKINKENSTRIKDKRKLSLLQTDFKILSGVLAGRLKKTEQHTISRFQFASGSKRISQAVCLTRDAIESVKPSQKVVLYETDYISAFDLMSIDWILKVLLKKGCSKSFVQTLRNIFQEEDTYVSCVVNNEVQERILNRRKNIKQGCRSSTLLYCFATDPLLIKLNKILKGLTYFSHPTAGPHHPLFGRPRPVVEKITAIGYVDDVKGFLTSVDEFHTLDTTLASFEAASGSRLHRSVEPTNQKCAALPLGRWAGWSSADCPLDYMKVVDHINLLGVKLARTTSRTRELAGSDLVSSVQSKLNHFRSGRHSSLVLKPHLANVYLLSKISHKSAAVHLYKTDVQKLQHAIKSWTTQELLKKPKELLLYRRKEDGGLGLVNVQARAIANLTRSFLHSVLSSSYSRAIYRAFVQEEEDAKQLVKKPSFYPESMFTLVKEAFSALGGQIFCLSAKQWQLRATENIVTHFRDPASGMASLLPSPAEETWPTHNWPQSRANLNIRGLTPNQRSTLYMLCNDLLTNSERLQKFKLATSAECPFCKEVDESLHFLSCSQAQGLGNFLEVSLTPIFFTEDQFSWAKVRSLDLNSASLHDKRAGLVLIAEVVSQILSSRKQSRAASWSKLSATIKCCAEATSKPFPESGTSLFTWSNRLRARCTPMASPDSSSPDSRAEEQSPGGHQWPSFQLSV